MNDKIITALDARKDNGMFIGVCAPFGYRKSEESIYKIEVDEETVFLLENQKPWDNSGLKFLEGNSEVIEITDELLDALLEKVVVYSDKTIELRWKFSNRSN